MKVALLARKGLPRRVGIGVLAAVVLLVLFGLFIRLAQPECWPLLRRSFWLGALAALGATPLGVALAILLTRTDIPLRRVLFAATAMMLFAPIYLQAAAWEAGFGRLGWYTLMSDQMAAPLLSGWRAAVWIHVAAAVPWVTMIVAAGLQYVDPDQEEAATLEGGEAAAFVFVSLPQLLAAIAVGALWVFVTTAAEMTVADLFFIKTYARELYNGFGLGDTLSESWRFAWPGFGMTIVLSIGAALCIAWAAPAGGFTSLRAQRRWRLGSLRIPFAIVALLLVLGFTAAPLVNLCLKAGWIAEVASQDRSRSWSLWRFAATVGGSAYRFHIELKWSVLIGALGASLAVAISAPMAWWARLGGWKAAPMLACSAVCVATPGPLLGMIMISIFSRDLGPLNALYDRSVFAPVLAVAFRAFPYAGAICWFAFRSLDARVVESSRLDGASETASLLQIAAPQRASALAAAWLVAFAIASGDLASTILVAPPGITTAAVRVFSLIHSGVRYQESALCLASLAVYLFAAGIAWRCFCGGWLFSADSPD